MSRLFFQFFFESCNFISKLSYFNELQGKFLNQSLFAYCHIVSPKRFLKVFSLTYSLIYSLTQIIVYVISGLLSSLFSKFFQRLLRGAWRTLENRYTHEPWHTQDNTQGHKCQVKSSQRASEALRVAWYSSCRILSLTESFSYGMGFAKGGWYKTCRGALGISVRKD